eukprot:m.200857 g.200857  ORF g.200857 m.200857 type:complete len:73 (-) comp16860_c9_seq2:106-324(-)
MHEKTGPLMPVPIVFSHCMVYSANTSLVLSSILLYMVDDDDDDEEGEDANASKISAYHNFTPSGQRAAPTAD